MGTNIGHPACVTKGRTAIIARFAFETRSKCDMVDGKADGGVTRCTYGPEVEQRYWYILACVLSLPIAQVSFLDISCFDLHFHSLRSSVVICSPVFYLVLFFLLQTGGDEPVEERADDNGGGGRALDARRVPRVHMKRRRSKSAF